MPCLLLTARFDTDIGRLKPLRPLAQDKVEPCPVRTLRCPEFNGPAHGIARFRATEKDATERMTTLPAIGQRVIVEQNSGAYVWLSAPKFLNRPRKRRAVVCPDSDVVGEIGQTGVR